MIKLMINGFNVEGTIENIREILVKPTQVKSIEDTSNPYGLQIMNCSK